APPAAGGEAAPSAPDTVPGAGAAGAPVFSRSASGGVGVSGEPGSAITLHPLERALLPGVVVADDEDDDEDQHLDQAEEEQLVEDDRPREHEHGLDVEDHEQH